MSRTQVVFGVFPLAAWFIVQANRLHIGHSIIYRLFETPTRQVQIAQVTYHATFTWDTDTNAIWHAVIVRTNGIELFRRYSLTNSVTVSNLSYPLDQYRFTAIATNSVGESDESFPATLHWMTVLESDSLNGPWTLLSTNQFIPNAPQKYIALSNFNAQTFLKKD